MKIIDLEHVSCGFCGSESFQKLYSAPKHSPYAECSIVQCDDCGLIRTNPRPSQDTLFETYTDDYYSRKDTVVSGFGDRYKIFAMKHSLAYLYPFTIPFHLPPEAKICDVGCGAGQWLKLLRSAYPDANLYGFEIDTKTAESASNSCRAEVHSGNFLNNNWESNSFDFITFWEVLEHISNPKEVLKEAKRLLKPNGYVIASLPNIESIYSKGFKQFWWALAFDAHLYHYSKKTLTNLVQACGLEPSYAFLPFIHPTIHYNVQTYLCELKFTDFKGKKHYPLLSATSEFLKLLDKSQFSRLASDHLLMYAKNSTFT
jgi:2-polyprenyl-3-methyl-5-hydroxy-6-metoxy-1,4-benzoquinol methylase